MKLSKKVLFGAALVAAIGFGFMSCADNEDEHGIMNGSGSKGTVDYTNEEAYTVRGFKTAKLNHATATSVITLSSEKPNTGNIGFLWNLEQDKTDKTYSFCNATFRLGGGSDNNSKDVIGYYVSYFKGVDTSEGNLDKDNNFKCKCKKEISNNACETCGAIEKEIKGAWQTINSSQFKNSDGTYTLCVRPVMNETVADTASKKYATGETVYTIKVCKKSTYDSASDKDAFTSETVWTDVILKADDIDMIGKIAGKDNGKDIGTYVSVNGNATMSGSWSVVDTLAAAEAVEE